MGERLTETMDDAQATIIPLANDEADLARQMADHVGVERQAAVSCLPTARILNWRSDALEAFGTRFSEVDDWRSLPFRAAIAYLESEHPGVHAPGIAVATAAVGMSGHNVEDAIIDHFSWMSDADEMWENKKVDAFADNDEKLQIKKNDSTQKRHDAIDGGLPDDVILVSYATADSDDSRDIPEGCVRVSFEGPDSDVIGHSVARLGE